MSIKKLCAVAVAFGVLCAPGVSVWAAVPNAEEQPVEALQARILADLASAPADEQALIAAITNATAGQPLDVITRALCPLGSTNLGRIYGQDQTAIAQGEATRSRVEVQSAISESCEVAQLALASYGATGGVPAGGAPGQAFAASGVGAPGGGGGSGYTN